MQNILLKSFFFSPFIFVNNFFDEYSTILYQLDKNFYNFYIPEILPFNFWEDISLFYFLFVFGYITFYIVIFLIVGIFGLNEYIAYPNFKSSLYLSIIYFFLFFWYIFSYNESMFYIILDNLNIFDVFYYISVKYICLYFLVILFITRYYTIYKHMNMLEYYLLLLSVFLATICLVSSIDFVSIFLSLEILSLTSYILVAYARNSIFSLEGGVKYFVIGSLASALFLIGASIFFAECGSTNLYRISLLLMDSEWITMPIYMGYFFIITSLLIKLGIVPFHFWLPDVYEGSPFNNMIFLGGVPKIGIFILFLRWLYLGDGFLLSVFQECFLFFGLFCVFIGALGALRQVSLKRFLAYSSINNFGFILIAASLNSVLGLSFSFFYFLVYLLSFITLSSLVIFWGFGYNASYFFEKFYGYFLVNIPIAILLTVLFLSFAGIPPFIGFFAKLLILFSLLGKNYFFLSFFLLVGSVFSSFYYIKIIKMIYTEKINFGIFFYQKQEFSNMLNYSFFVFGGTLLLVLSFYPEFLLLDSLSVGLNF